MNNSHHTDGGGVYGGVYTFDEATTKTTVQLLFFTFKGGNEHTALKRQDFQNLVFETSNAIVEAFPDIKKCVKIDENEDVENYDDNGNNEIDDDDDIEENEKNCHFEPNDT